MGYVAPNIAQEDRTAHVQGFYTLHNEKQEKEDTTFMKTPQTKDIHCQCCMQKQLQGKT